MTTPNTVDALISEALDHVQALERVPGQTSGSVQRHATLAANALRTIEASASSANQQGILDC